MLTLLPLNMLIGEAIGSMIITLPIGLMLMALFAHPWILKRKWHQVLGIAVALSLINGFTINNPAIAWIVMGAIAYSFYRREDYFKEER